MVGLPSFPLLFAFASGLGFVGYGLRRYYGQERANPYDGTTSGTVLVSDIDPDQSAENGDYTPSVRYEYSVDGVAYENDRVRAATDNLSRRGATVLLGEYHEDADVTVHYDPRAPDRSVLVPPEGGQIWLVLVVVGFFVAMTTAGISVLGL